MVPRPLPQVRPALHPSTPSSEWSAPHADCAVWRRRRAAPRWAAPLTYIDAEKARIVHSKFRPTPRCLGEGPRNAPGRVKRQHAAAPDEHRPGPCERARSTCGEGGGEASSTAPSHPDHPAPRGPRMTRSWGSRVSGTLASREPRDRFCKPGERRRGSGPTQSPDESAQTLGRTNQISVHARQACVTACRLRQR